MHLDCGTVQADGFDLDADNRSMLQLRKSPIEHAALRPAIHSGVDGVPVAESPGQTAPFATLLGNEQDRVQDSQIGQAHIAALGRQTVLDQAVLRFADFPSRSISPFQGLVLTRPSAIPLMSAASSTPRQLIIATRKSALAMWQAGARRDSLHCAQLTRRAQTRC